MNESFSRLLGDNIEKLKHAGHIGPVLDLACGNGRNGLHLIENGIPVIFSDINSNALAEVSKALLKERYLQHKSLATLHEVDLEAAESTALEQVQYGAVIVFRYLHRPLMESIKAAVKPGGLVIYETFTLDQRQFGRPTNPDFLLGPNELKNNFNNWNIHFSYEGILCKKPGRPQSAIAQIVASKPH